MRLLFFIQRSGATSSHRAYRKESGWIKGAEQLGSELWQEYKELPLQFQQANLESSRPIDKTREVEVDSFPSYLDSFRSNGTAEPVVSEASANDKLDRWLRLADPVEKDCDPFLYCFHRSEHLLSN